MKTIAFVTYKKQPSLNKSDSILAKELGSVNISVHAVPWDKNVKWTQFDAVVLRSCWDYHSRYHDFFNWLDLLEQANVRVWNPIPTVRWNSHKSYLLDLQKKGVQIPPTRLIPKNQPVRLEELLPWETAIMKPAVGASAVNVIKIEKSNVKKYEKLFQKVLSDGDIIIQEYIKEIESKGETSLIFFGNAFSHAVIKRPKKGGFLASFDYGGTEELFHPNESLITQAKNILSTGDRKSLYARVDGIIMNHKFLLMELELIEPLLFIDLAPQAATLFAKTFIELSD